MRIISHKKLFLPAYSIILVVLLLIFLISISTYRTLDHQEKTALTFLKSQGITLLEALEAGALTGMLMPMWSNDSVNQLIQEISKSKNIAYIYIYDEKGNVLHDSRDSANGPRIIWRPELDGNVQLASRLTGLDDGSQVFELAQRFTPNLPMTTVYQNSMFTHGHIGTFDDHHTGDIVVLGLRMDEIEAAHHSDIQHAIVMGVILFLLGSATLFFAFVIQNYYLVDKALKQSRDYLRQVVDSMPSGMLSINEEGKITSYNKLAMRFLGLTDANVNHSDLGAVLDFDSWGIKNALTDGKSISEKEIVHRNRSSSSEIPLAVSISPVIDEDGLRTGAVIILRDLTEIKLLQEKIRRSERLAAVGEFAAGVAHEVRNPLSSIRGFAQFLAQVLKDKPVEKEYTDIMVKEVDRINSVVTNLLLFARPLKPHRSSTDIERLIIHTVRLVEEDAKTRNVAIRVSIPQDLEKAIVDGDQMTQVMLNLILNALQAVDSGGIIEIGASVDNSGNLELSVEDDGPGIPSEHAGKIFDPFFSTKEKGSGLGLAIVHMIVEYHDGEIFVASPVPGKQMGTRITILIPLQPEPTGKIESEQD